MKALNQKATYSTGNIMQQNELFYSYFNCLHTELSPKTDNFPLEAIAYNSML